MEKSEITHEDVKKLSHREASRTTGGNAFWLGVAGGLVGHFIYEVFNDWDANVAAYNEGLNGY